ncbi:hypothetical protein BMMGA3_15775 [Bacillus methanolicus MGA3]|uniref:Uncharacterized protein n=1 Tax=Bacillus methanolicus (strain MGA3 / ATCC 53907) TaxID=796606 RepID=A0A068LWZ3_BACMM|nr:hypothetical protein BMMGA3_15775 [Bacillus methanolicus MGA3]
MLTPIEFLYSVESKAEFFGIDDKKVCNPSQERRVFLLIGDAGTSLVKNLNNPCKYPIR